MGDREALGAQELRVLEYIRSCLRATGRPPTAAEGAQKLFNSTSPRSFAYWVDRLEEKGYVRRGKGHRNLELVDDPGPGLPLIGIVAAGAPLPPGDDQGRFCFNQEFPEDGGDLVTLKVKGESMIDAHIASGDYVIVRRDPDPPTGTKVVVSIDGQLTLKKLSRVNRQVVLVPYNRDVKAQPLREDESTFIVGVLVGVVRKC